MALQIKVGVVQAKLSVGTEPYIGVGFQPKAIIFWCSKTSEAIASSFGVARFSYGFTTGSSNNYGIGFFDAGTQGSSISGAHIFSNSACILMGQNPGGPPWEAWTSICVAKLSSFDSDGFTLDFTTAGSAFQICYMAIGGDGIDVSSGDTTEGTSTGNYSVTTESIQANLGIFLFTSFTSFTNANSPVFGLGYAVSSSMRGMTFRRKTNANYASVTARSRLRTTKVMEVTASNSDTILSDSDFVSFNTDGFTLNRATDDGNDRKIAYLLIKGIEASIEEYAKPTTTGDDENTGAGFAPDAVMMVSHASTAASVSHAYSGGKPIISIGAGVSSTEMAHCGEGFYIDWSGYTGDVFDDDEILQFHNVTAATLSDEAALVSLDSDGHTINWSTSAASAKLFHVISIADNTGGGDLSISGATDSITVSEDINTNLVNNVNLNSFEHKGIVIT